MFIIWYFLFSFIYLIILILDFFFYKVLKLNNKFFNIIFKKIKKFFIFFDKINENKYVLTSADLNNLNKNLDFKNLYSEYSFFNNKLTNNFNSNNSFKNTLIFFNLNKKLLNKFNIHFVGFNFVFYILFKKFNKNLNFIKKTNLNFLANNISIKNKLIKKSFVFNKNYIVFKEIYFKLVDNTIIISNNFFKNVNDKWIIKYSPSNFIKYIDFNNTDMYNILYLRKNKVFNKGRYSRNRQYYRTGVYWCLYVNIIAVIGIYFWFYRFTMNFGYLWWLLFLFIFSFVAPKTLKYRLYNPLNIFNSFYKDLLFITYILLSFNNFLYNAITIVVNFFKNYFFNWFFFNFSQFIKKEFFLNTIILNIYKILINILNIKKINNSIYIWEYNNTNYYCNSITNSSPLFFEKLKNNLVQFFYFSFSK